MRKIQKRVATPEQLDEAEALQSELESDDVLSGNVSEAEIEAKYDTGQARILIQRNDFLVPNLLEMIRNHEVLNIAPKYQRRPRWNRKKQSHLIESLLMNVPIPPVFLYEHDLAKYEVMDGQQRLTAIRSFFDNEFGLSDLKTWPELNRRTFAKLPPKIQAGLKRRGLAAVIILTESGQGREEAMELRQYVFERLNTGGERLNPQEVRNCIYAGRFNDMLIRLARSPLFTNAWGIPPKESREPQRISQGLRDNRLYSTMHDCEIVLRYFALRNIAAFKSGMKQALDSHMDRMRDASASDCVALDNEYISVLKIARDVYGGRLFRLPDSSGELHGRRSVPLADAVLLAIRRYVDHSDKIRERKAKLVLGTRRLLNRPTSYEALVGRGNTKSAIEQRIRIMTRLVKQVVSA